MTYNEALVEIQALSTKMMNLTNNVGVTNYDAHSCLTEASIVLYEFLEKEKLKNG